MLTTQFFAPGDAVFYESGYGSYEGKVVAVAREVVLLRIGPGEPIEVKRKLVRLAGGRR